MGDKVFIKVTPFKHMIRFRRKAKLAPRYINSYDIVEKVSKVAYRLTLPMSMKRIHDAFYVSLLCKYIGDPSHILRSKRFNY